MPGRSYKTEAVVLRSLRFGEADCVLHLYTRERGHVGAVAKGVRRTKSRFGGRLEPLSHSELLLHEGRGELHTVTGVDLVRSHHAAREQPYRLGVGLIGLEAMLRLFPEEEANDRAFTALTRFLDLVDVLDPIAGAPPSLEPLVLAFQLKLLWLSGYLPHLTSCADCGAAGPLAGYSPRAGGAVCRDCFRGDVRLSPRALVGVETLLRLPLADARRVELDDRSAHEALSVVTSSYEYHGGFRLRTLASAARRS